MILLFTALCLQGKVASELKEVTSASLRHMSLLFVPAGAGLMMYVGQLRSEWGTIVAAVVGGTLCTLAVAALSLRLFRALKPLFFGRMARES